jgi:hypothetical protein
MLEYHPLLQFKEVIFIKKNAAELKKKATKSIFIYSYDMKLKNINETAGLQIGHRSTSKFVK